MRTPRPCLGPQDRRDPSRREEEVDTRPTNKERGKKTLSHVTQQRQCPNGLTFQPNTFDMQPLPEHQPFTEGDHADSFCNMNSTAAIPCAVIRSVGRDISVMSRLSRPRSLATTRAYRPHSTVSMPATSTMIWTRRGLHGSSIAPIDYEHEVDHLIIGAGVVGLAIAERLSARGAGSTLLVDKNPAAGQETRYFHYAPRTSKKIILKCPIGIDSQSD